MIQEPNENYLPPRAQKWPCTLRLLSCCLALFLLSLSSFAQQTGRDISGKVGTASGEPIEGATISVKGAGGAVASGSDGSFSIHIPENAILVISFVGYIEQEVNTTGLTEFNFTLMPSTQSMDDIVVVGYTAQRKSTITGAATSVNMADLSTRRVPDVGQLLQGSVAGVQVTQSTGAPGDGIEIRIRGNGTIGNNNPLYIVDGIPSRDINFVNPQDIESMTVLKDAAAAAIYGSRAASGVVVITTKGGKKGKPAVELNYFTGFHKVANLPTMLNGSQYMDKMEESWNNSGLTGTNPYTTDKPRTDLANTNWLDELFTTGRSQNVAVTASGGDESVQYLISGGYYKQNGIVIYDNDQYERINFRSNVIGNLTNRLKVGANLQITNIRQDKTSSSGDAPGIIRHAFLRAPVIPVFKDPSDPTYSSEDPYTDLPFYYRNVQDNGGSWNGAANRYEFSANPIALAYFTNDKRVNLKTFGNAFAEYAFLAKKELKFRTNFGIDLNMLHNKAFNQNFGDVDGGGAEVDKALGRQNRPGSLNENRGQETTITWNNTLQYNKKISDHNISILGGTEYIQNRASSIGASRARFEYTQPTFQYLDFGGTAQDLWNSGTASEWALFSLFGSANYNFQNKYFVTASLRADASSRFSPDNQWGYFPSVSVGWRISQESFLKEANWLSDLKLRASTGTLGNQEIDNYAYLTLLRKSGEQYLISRYGNPDLKWESTRQDNIGLDVGFLKNKLNFTFDYFKKTTSDILLPISLPALVGNVSATVVNAGTVMNKGFEASVSYDHTANAFTYGISANIATLKNEVVKLHPNLPNLTGPVTKTEAGYPLNSYFGYVMEGIYQNTSEIASHLHGVSSPSQVPGDIRFKDLNGDGIINDNDRTHLGNPNPRLMYGANFRLGYKGLDLSFLFQGAEGVERYNDLKKIIDYDSRPFNHTVATLGAWNGEGSTNTMPRSTFQDNGSSFISSIFVEDASYLRLKNIELGYDLGRVVKSGNVFQNCRLYVSAQNLFTVTKYTGLDPESTALIDQGTYPQSRNLMLGINVRF